MFNSMASVWEYRELLWQLTVRELKVRYKQALLGVLWAILQPLTLMVIFTFVFSRVLGIQTPENAPYPVFCLLGLLPWLFFSSSLLVSINSLTGNANLVTKVYFPRLLLPLSSVLSALADFVIAIGIFLVIALLYGVGPYWSWLWVAPVFAMQFLFTFGLGLIFSALNVKYRDFRYVVPLVLQVWMFMTPVFYSADMIPGRYYVFYMLNPMACFIDGYHRAVLAGVAPFSVQLASAFALGALVLAGALKYFRTSERVFAEVI